MTSMNSPRYNTGDYGAVGIVAGIGWANAAPGSRDDDTPGWEALEEIVGGLDRICAAPQK